jgi:hypothetical protein
MGMTALAYLLASIPSVLGTAPVQIRAAAIEDEKSMCHKVRVMGKGKPPNARMYLLNRMTDADRAIHMLA